MTRRYRYNKNYFIQFTGLTCQTSEKHRGNLSGRTGSASTFSSAHSGHLQIRMILALERKRASVSSPIRQCHLTTLSATRLAAISANWLRKICLATEITQRSTFKNTVQFAFVKIKRLPAFW